MLALAIVAVAVALPLRDLFRHQGPPMEEGFMLVFPERVLRGAIPNQDFLHLYGPGSLWALAAWFKVAGVSLAAERFYGLVQHIGIILGVFFLARPWGRRVATAAAVIAALITLTAIGLTALAWNGAVALGLLSLNLGLRARRRAGERSDADSVRRLRRGLLVAGVVGGLALTFRPDLAIAVAAAMAVVAWGWGESPRRVKPVVAGLAVGLSPYLVHLATAGVGNSISGMVIDPVFKLRAGRSLPRPPSWSHYDGALQKVADLIPPPWAFPSLRGPHQVFLWFFLLPIVAVAVAVVGWRKVRRHPDSVQARTLLASGVFCVGMLPQAFQRPDTTHLAWVSCVTLALLPVLFAEVLGARGRAWHPSLVSLVPPIAAFAVLFVVIPFFSFRPYVDLSRRLVKPSPTGYAVSRGGRNFYLGSEPITPAADALIKDLSARSHAGQRLLVGPVDLRKTIYSDAYFYYLFPELVPGTYYIEMDPSMANRPDSGLDQEVAKSDWLILSNVWNNWEEENTSRDFGSNKPNEVVRRHFCQVRSYGHYLDKGQDKPYFELWQRCR